MTDRERNQNQQNRQPQSSDQTQRTSPRHEEDVEHEGIGSSSRTRATDRASADDRGLGRERDRRSFSGDREHDELGSEMEDNHAAEDSDDMDMDDGLGGSRRSDR